MGAIYVLTIEHKHGHDLWVHQTREGAQRSLVDFASDYWQQEVGDHPKPIDEERLIREYFQATEGREWWSLDEAELLP